MPNKDLDTRNWNPVYCRLAYIAGMEDQKAQCERILGKLGPNERVVTVIRVSGDWLYGQCNFKLDPKDGHNFKFVDTMQTIVTRDLEIFAKGGVSKLIFVEHDLFENFESIRDRDFETFEMDSVLVKE